MGFTGHHASAIGSFRQSGATLIMSMMVAVVIMLIIDNDWPARGLLQVPSQALVDAARGIPP